MTDLGAHHFDIAQWGLGMDDSGPVEIIPPEDPKATQGVRYLYANGVEMIHGGPAACSSSAPTARSPSTAATSAASPTRSSRSRWARRTSTCTSRPAISGTGSNCIRSRKRPICDVEIGARSVTVCHLGNLAYWNHRTLHWDPKEWQFVDDAEANKWLDRERRDPWQLPNV